MVLITFLTAFLEVKGDQKSIFDICSTDITYAVACATNVPVLYHFWPKDKNQDKYFWSESLSFLGE